MPRCGPLIRCDFRHEHSSVYWRPALELPYNTGVNLGMTTYMDYYDMPRYGCMISVWFYGWLLVCIMMTCLGVAVWFLCDLTCSPRSQWTGSAESFDVSMTSECGLAYVLRWWGIWSDSFYVTIVWLVCRLQGDLRCRIRSEHESRCEIWHQCEFTYGLWSQDNNLFNAIASVISYLNVI